MVFLRYTLFALLLMAGIMAAPVIYHYSKGNLSAPVFSEKQKADAVMVFTGSPDRIAQGYKFYLNGVAKKLMFTGFDYPQDARTPSVRKLSKKVRKDKVTIDLTAKNTIENAKNGAAWAIENKVKSIVLVTTADHMPRAYFELRRLLPDDVKIYTEAVPGDLEYPGVDSEQSRLLCRVYETATGTSFCYKTRNMFRTLEGHHLS